MAKYAVLKSFYASGKWITFRQCTIAYRTNTKGEVICEHCHQPITNLKEVIVHHEKELTPENVGDANISLNPVLVKVVHSKCHNEIHHRFGNKPTHNVYIVFGAPMSGKSTYVNQIISRGDIVVDMNRLYSAVTMLPEYDKPNSLFSNVMGIHNALIDNIKTRYGKWNDCYIVGGYADKYKRERLANDLGAYLIYCDVSKEECLLRLEVDKDRQFRKVEWKKFIEDWFEKFSM